VVRGIKNPRWISGLLRKESWKRNTRNKLRTRRRSLSERGVIELVEVREKGGGTPHQTPRKSESALIGPQTGRGKR